MWVSPCTNKLTHQSQPKDSIPEQGRALDSWEWLGNGMNVMSLTWAKNLLLAKQRLIDYKLLWFIWEVKVLFLLVIRLANNCKGCLCSHTQNSKMRYLGTCWIWFCYNILIKACLNLMYYHHLQCEKTN